MESLGINPNDEGQRLQKILSNAGLASRRRAEELILDGRIKVNGKRVELGARADVAKDVITLDGVPIMADNKKVYYLLNKPVGVVSTTSDTHNRPTVVDLVPHDTLIYPVGRLDADSEGLLILTNDGDLTNRLTHPSYKVEKEYLVELDQRPRADVLRAFTVGIELEDGRTHPARAFALEGSGVRVIISEGRNRQIRRMFDEFNYRVERLVRIRIGSLTDTKLKPGESRELTRSELMNLWSAVATDKNARQTEGES